jgi:hypothetical protein
MPTEALERAVGRFGLVRPVAELDRGEQRGEPQQPGRDLAEQELVRAEREAEREQHGDRERQDRAQRGPAAELGPQVLGGDRLGDPQAHDGAAAGAGAGAWAGAQAAAWAAPVAVGVLGGGATRSRRGRPAG